MSIDTTALLTLAQPSVKEIFRLILKFRTVSRYQLEITDFAEKETLDNALGSLESAGLIARTSGESKERDRFYPTGSGLTMEKYL